MKKRSNYSYKKRHNIRGKKTRKGLHISKNTIVVVLGMAFFLFVAKIFLQPIGSALAGLLRESSASFSVMLNNEGLSQTNGVTTILLVGVDQRAGGQTSLTDTLMLASYNHKDTSITVVSLPRDLWVTIPSFNDVYEQGAKINAVYSFGQSYNYSNEDGQGLNGGIGLLENILTKNIGMPIHYYALVNFSGFRNVVDAVDGVDIFVKETFTDYGYPKDGYESAPWDSRWEVITFNQGWQHMDGETALKYARSRHAYGPEGSDFARAARQQAVILAIKEKIISSQTLFNVNRLRQLFTTLSSDFESNVSISQLPVFYNLYTEIDGFDTVKSYVLSNDPSQEGGILYEPSPDEFGGAYVLLPRQGWESVKEFIHTAVFGTSEE
ncbi:hypothetical protein CO180_02170 [candidate division WWE3 bacterium CG_4_9_14_3_um_filter_41_6]|uniref:Cell envelope-related transcriptional attenuator domain-containing protein n=1 Tax=candidate division WWE3 bacterium CG_4_10_14_0_2_um_filter_41_14 TaxID=1975072 RepID=A0A2M7TK20_UNCKA|nr:MAG: hypothetical protein COY32_02410 [candidate division WWE3 bacterium CG_4_10_14_0_2_um_filter_41_14]PJA38875.1 MAG: hypothetical protein CO180_02170 [candidate division WWE3 bacterium CG_4_9_14_3_um_filter_41_6]